MYTMRKRMIFGEMQTDIEINRSVLNDIMCRFQEYFKEAFSVAREAKNLKDVNLSEEEMRIFNAADETLSAEELEIKNGIKERFSDASLETMIRTFSSDHLSYYLTAEMQTEEVARYSLPLMIGLANKGRTGFDAAKEADAIFAYAAENDSVSVLADGILSFIFEGFTLTADERKPKIKLEIV